MKNTPYIKNWNHHHENTTSTPVARMVSRRYTPEQMAKMSLLCLNAFRFYPEVPRPIDVESFADCIAYVYYQEMADGLLGKTVFSYDDMPRIYISTSLAEPKTPAQLGQLRFVFAHELGHVILHNPLYKEACDLCNHTRPRYNASEIRELRTACFDKNDNYGIYFGSQYEYQATRAGMFLLMPPELLHRAVFAYMGSDMHLYACGKLTNLASRMADIVEHVQSVFAVERSVAEFGVRRMFRAHRVARAKNLSFYETVQTFA